MKKTLIILCLLFSSSVVADDISDFQIEGMSVGDSLLDYISEENIISEVKENQYLFGERNTEYGMVDYNKNLKTYNRLNLVVKANDKNYSIYSVRGMIDIYNIDECIEKQKEVVSEVKYLFPKTIRTNFNGDYDDFDPSKKSYSKEVELKLVSEDAITIVCSHFSKEMLTQYPSFVPGLDITILHKDFLKWLF